MHLYNQVHGIGINIIRNSTMKKAYLQPNVDIAAQISVYRVVCATVVPGSGNNSGSDPGPTPPPPHHL